MLHDDVRAARYLEKLAVLEGASGNCIISLKSPFTPLLHYVRANGPLILLKCQRFSRVDSSQKSEKVRPSDNCAPSLIKDLKKKLYLKIWKDCEE